MKVTVRRGGSADAGVAADLWLRARAAARATIPPPRHTNEDVRRWFASHVVQELELWLAESVDREVVGMLVLDGPWVDQLYLDPDWIGRGIGTRLIEFAKNQRPAGLRLWTFASNRRAQRFYERNGFLEVQRTDGRHNEERAPDIEFAWPGP